MSTPPPVEADPFLGEAIANYPSDRGRPLLIAGVIGGAAAVLLNFTFAAVPEWWGPAITVVLMAGLGLALGWYVLHIWNREIILYERGFSYREGSNTVHFFYNEIRGVRLLAERRSYFGGLLQRNVYRYTVTTAQGETFVITNLYRRAAELGSKLTEHLNRTLEPILASRLAKGEAVAFGETLQVSAAGLREGERQLAWEGYGGYRIGGRQLALLDAAGEVWYSAPLAEIENITLLLDILRERQKLKAEQ
jgi:hypothetical protein